MRWRAAWQHARVDSHGRGCAVLLSGGVDSAVVLALLIAETTPIAVWVDYGQPAAAAEREASKAIAAHYGTAWTETAVAGLRPPAAGEFPGRNDLLVAAARAAMAGRSVAIGVHAGTGYADCSVEWTAAWQALLDAQHRGSVNLLAPLVGLTKAQVYGQAVAVGVPVALTHSCEAGPVACGLCSSCADRTALDALA